MKALSIREPHISRILAGEKTLEIRSWATAHRGEILLVGSRSPNGPCAGLAVAQAILVDIRPMRPDDCDAACAAFREALVWVLDDVKPLMTFPVKGRLGIYDVPTDRPPLQPARPGR